MRADLAALRVSLDLSGIPPKNLDRNVLIGTWNIRGFGKVLNKWESAPTDSPKRNLRDVLCLAAVISLEFNIASRVSQGKVPGWTFSWYE